jgi:hypothetical protein
MIIWGSRGITSRQGEGEFHCPKCAERRRYEKKQVRRFFTLYFIPIIPLDVHGTFIQCATCRSEYTEKVLAYRPPPTQAELVRAFNDAVARVMAIGAYSDGAVSARRLAALAEQHQRVVGAPLANTDLQQLLARESFDPAAATAAIHGVVASLTEVGKENLFTAVYAVIAADGAVTEAGRQFAAAVAGALGFTEAHLGGLIAKLQAPAGA